MRLAERAVPSPWTATMLGVLVMLASLAVTRSGSPTRPSDLEREVLEKIRQSKHSHCDCARPRPPLSSAARGDTPGQRVAHRGYASSPDDSLSDRRHSSTRPTSSKPD